MSQEEHIPNPQAQPSPTPDMSNQMGFGVPMPDQMPGYPQPQYPQYNPVYQGFYGYPPQYQQPMQFSHSQPYPMQQIPQMPVDNRNSYQQQGPIYENNGWNPTSEQPETTANSLAYIDKKTRIAVYNDMLASPRIVDIEPNETKAYIGELAATVYNLASEEGGSIPYTVILELVENFIHAHFKESVVSILDHGNTIRFSDQGPGIEKKSQAQQPGFSSATSEMKEYIRGVGSGFPIVKSYLSVQNGKLLVEDNINQGTVITISLNPVSALQSSVVDEAMEQPQKSELNEREISILKLARERGSIRLVDVSSVFGYPNSSTHNMISHLVELGYIEGTPNPTSKTKALTSKGEAFLSQL